MKKLKILIVEGNLTSENKNFKDAGIQTHTESLKESITNYNNNINYEILNPSSEDNFNKIIGKLESFDGLVWGGSSLNIYHDTPEIKRQIFFMKECFNKVKNIFHSLLCYILRHVQGHYHMNQDGFYQCNLFLLALK